MARSAAASTASPEEVARFQAMAESWWDPNGECRPLHQLNPPRLSFLRDRLAAHFGRDPKAEQPFAGLTLLDVGCGGGLLSEPMARLGFAVTGIDAADQNIRIAKLHAAEGGLPIDYRCDTPEHLDGQFDVVMAMEVVEHVPDVNAFLAALAPRLKKGGAFAGATVNRTAKSFALAIVGAEYVLRWLPRGTHNWRKFLRPSELAHAMRRSDIEATAFEGVRYDVLHDRWDRCRDLEVNYLVFGVKG